MSKKENTIVEFVEEDLNKMIIRYNEYIQKSEKSDSLQDMKISYHNSLLSVIGLLNKEFRNLLSNDCKESLITTIEDSLQWLLECNEIPNDEELKKLIKNTENIKQVLYTPPIRYGKEDEINNSKDLSDEQKISMIDQEIQKELKKDKEYIELFGSQVSKLKDTAIESAQNLIVQVQSNKTHAEEKFKQEEEKENKSIIEQEATVAKITAKIFSNLLGQKTMDAKSYNEIKNTIQEIAGKVNIKKFNSIEKDNLIKDISSEIINKRTNKFIFSNKTKTISSNNLQEIKKNISKKYSNQNRLIARNKREREKRNIAQSVKIDKKHLSQNNSDSNILLVKEKNGKFNRSR